MVLSIPSSNMQQVRSRQALTNNYFHNYYTAKIEIFTKCTYCTTLVQIM